MVPPLLLSETLGAGLQRFALQFAIHSGILSDIVFIDRTLLLGGFCWSLCMLYLWGLRRARVGALWSSPRPSLEAFLGSLTPFKEIK